MSQRVEPSAIRLTALVGAYKDPHGLYDAVRARDAIAFDTTSKCWLVTSHAAIRKILADERFSSELTTGVTGAPPGARVSFVQAAIQKQILFTDGERHRRVQKVILQHSARTMHQLQPAMRDLAHRLLEPARARGTFDLVTEFALPYALETICLMVGVPTDDRQRMADLAQWSTTFANVTSGYLLVRINEIAQLGDYFRELVARRRERPEGVVGTFLQERTFDDEEDLIVNCMMVFAAGRVTTQKLLSDGIPMLCAEWHRWRALCRDDPGVARHLTEELLRIVTPTRYLARHAVEDVDLSSEFPGDHIIRKGQRVILFLEAGDRDPESFDEPHQLLHDRAQNAHVAFGFGRHRCPGASIARVEIQIAIEAMLAIFTELRRNPATQPTWDPNPNLGGFTSYPCLCR